MSDAPSRIDPRVEQLPGESDSPPCVCEDGPHGSWCSNRNLLRGPRGNLGGAEGRGEQGPQDVVRSIGESGHSSLPGGVGDSPVRGTLVEREPTGIAVAGEAGTGEPSSLKAAGEASPTSLQAKRAASLARVDDRIRTRNANIVADASLGPAFDPAGPKPEGMSERRWRIIKASWANMKAAPTWLTQAYRVTESYKKAEADRPQAPTINAEVVQVHVSVANYPRRRLSEE
jgi:hypothetical protein